MSRVFADDIPIATDEPFGMNGVMSWLKPLVAVVCGFLGVLCAVMAYHSETRRLGVYRESPNSLMILESIFGRLQFQIATIDDPSRTTDYNTIDRPIGSRRDFWAPSWRKTIGIDWGDETAYFSRRPLPVWQFRIRWRTLGVFLAAPPALLIYRGIRQKMRGPTDESDAAY